jgi:signal transduction histidine kinase
VKSLALSRLRRAPALTSPAAPDAHAHDTPAPAAAAARRSRRLPWFLRSAGVRFAAVYAVLLSLSAFALALFLWWQTAGLLNRQTDAAIRADAQGLFERWNEGGVPALLLTIQERLAQNVDDDAIYLLADARLRRVAGNLAHWPSGVTEATGWFELPVERAGAVSLARIHQFELPGGFRLLVGRDVQVRAKLARLLTDALFWAFGVVAVMAAVGAALVRSLFRRTLANVSATADAIAAGDLTQRVRISGRGDEFDRLAETINDMLERIARLMDGVRQVSNAIAHDLRTPIARARARLEDAALTARGEEELRAAIERAMLDLDGITAVFQALLRIAEIEAGSRRSAFCTLDLGPLLADLAELYAAVAEEKGARLEVAVPPRLPAYGDREMIQQAVANLLDNAVKFSPAGGRILLAAEARAHGVRIIVADEGPGIPDADRGRATERFFRGETARATPGSGLGLALVQAVANLHGGTLVLSDNAPGLRAELDLPRDAPKEAARLPAPEPPSFSSGNA